MAVRSALAKLINRIEGQVEAGEKFPVNLTSPPQTTGASFTMFINEFTIGDNSVFLELDNLKMVALHHNIINYILTTDKTFVDYTQDSIRTPYL